MELIDILNEIWSSNELLRNDDLRRASLFSSYGYLHTDELTPSEEYCMIMCFFICAYYNGMTDRKYDDITDFAIELHTNMAHSVTMAELFDSMVKNFAENQILSVMSIIGPYDLNNFKSEDNDIILRDWLLNHLPFEYSILGTYSRTSVLKVFENTASHLGIKNKKGTLLVRGENTYLTKAILSRNYLDWEGTYLFYPSSKRLWQIISLITSISNNNKIQCLKYSNDMNDVIPFDVQLDGIICVSSLYTPKRSAVFNLENVYEHVAKGGFCLVFNQPIDKISNMKLFKKLNIPIIFENKDINEKVYLCLNDGIISDVVRICDTETQIQEEQEYVVNSSSKAILGNIYSEEYQKLSKSDFLFAKNRDISFENIRRPIDQMDFVFMDLSELISMKTNKTRLFGPISDNKIIERYSLSSNPFNLSAPLSFYADKSILEDDGLGFYKDVDYEIRRDGHIDPIWPEEYILKFVSLHDIEESNLSSELVQFKNKLTCRVCVEPTILMAQDYQHDRYLIMKIKGSPEKPVCYRSFAFWDDPQGFVGAVRIKEIEVNPNFDENFILYQIMHSKTRRHILVLQCKDAQRKYYQKKYDEYKLANADLIKSIRQETYDSISSTIHNTKHTITNRLADVGNILSIISRELKRSDIIGKDSIVEELIRAKKITSKVTDDLVILAGVIDEKPLPQNIYRFLNDYISGLVQSKNYIIITDIDKQLEDKQCMLGVSSVISAFDNIVLNAERHAFTNARKDNRMLISAKKYNGYVEIRFANNGTPPDSTLTEKGYFTDGVSAGKNANSGHGGALVKQFIEEQGGITHLILNDEEYSFIVQIQIPFIL